MTMPRGKEEPLPQRLLDNPNKLRERAQQHRLTAMAEPNPERRRSFVMLAKEYDRLADAVEASIARAGDD